MLCQGRFLRLCRGSMPTVILHAGKQFIWIVQVIELGHSSISLMFLSSTSFSSNVLIDHRSLSCEVLHLKRYQVLFSFRRLFLLILCCSPNWIDCPLGSNSQVIGMCSFHIKLSNALLLWEWWFALGAAGHAKDLSGFCYRDGLACLRNKLKAFLLFYWPDSLT